MFSAGRLDSPKAVRQRALAKNTILSHRYNYSDLSGKFGFQGKQTSLMRRTLIMD